MFYITLIFNFYMTIVLLSFEVHYVVGKIMKLINYICFDLFLRHCYWNSYCSLFLYVSL